MNNILNLSVYTVGLYREKFREPQPVGSGLLLEFHGKHLLISAYHVIDMEDERISIENDTDEVCIPQDDMESIRAKGIDSLFLVNDNVKALVWTAHYNAETTEPIFNDDIEWCVCELSNDMVRHFIEKGKSFYQINDEIALDLKLGTQVILSGYPGYAQKPNEEICRSYESKLTEDFRGNKTGLFRVHFNQSKAYCIELEKEIQIPPKDGISGMSGGGLWCMTDGHCIPLGIIIKQDPNNNFVEGYSLTEILKTYSEK